MQSQKTVYKQIFKEPSLLLRSLSPNIFFSLIRYFGDIHYSMYKVELACLVFPNTLPWYALWSWKLVYFITSTLRNTVF